MEEKLAPVGVEHHNRVLRRAEKRALELEEKLVAILAPIVERAGHVAAANFEAFATDHLTAAGEPEFCLPAELRGKTDPVRQAVAKTVMGTALEEAGLSFDVTNPFAAKVLNQAASQVTHIAETTRADVMKVIRVSYDQGYSIPDTAKAIRAYMTEASPIRARLIARTELAGAVNGASLAATQIVARATGETYYKQWLTAPGARYPRHEDYEGLDHQTTTLDGYFDVGGFDLQHPGDPDGPPGEICNCRCALIYVTQEADLAASAIPRENGLDDLLDVHYFLAGTLGLVAAAEPPKWTPPAASEILQTDCTKAGVGPTGEPPSTGTPSRTPTPESLTLNPPTQADIGITPFRAGEDNVVGFYDSSKFQQFTQDVERSAREFGVTVDQQERVTGIWQGETEPSVSLQVHDGELGVRAMAADLGRAYNQDGVLLFTPGKEGDLIATYEKVLPQQQVFEAMRQVGLDGGRFTTDGKLQVIGGGPEFTAQLDRLASLLASPYNAGVGRFGILERETGDYDKALGDFARVEGKQVVPRGYGSEGDPGVAVAGQVAPGGQEGAEALQLERFPAGSIPQDLEAEVLDWPEQAQEVGGAAIIQNYEAGRATELLTLRDSNGTLRALASILTGEKSIVIDDLASAGGGAGTALLRRIAGEAASAGKGLRLSATPEAISYYERFPQFIAEAVNKFYMPPDRVAEFAKGGEPFRIVEPASPEVGDVAATNEGVREELTKGCDGEGLTSAAAPSYCLPAFVKSIGGEIVSEPGSDRAALAEQLNRYADTHPFATTTGDVIDAQIPTYEIRTEGPIAREEEKINRVLHELILVEEYVISQIALSRLNSFRLLFKRKDGRVRFMLNFNQQPIAEAQDVRAFIQRTSGKQSLSQPQQEQQALEYPSGSPPLVAVRKKEQQQLPRALAARLDQPPEAQQVTYVGVPASAGSVSVAGLVRTYMLGDRAVIERLVRGGSWVVDTSENTLRLIDEGAQVSPWFAAVLYDSLRSVV